MALMLFMVFIKEALSWPWHTPEWFLLGFSLPDFVVLTIIGTFHSELSHRGG